MKICFFTQNLYTLGGVQRVVINTINSMAEKGGIEIDIVMSAINASKEVDGDIISDRVKIWNMVQITKGQKPKAVKKLVMGLNRRYGLFSSCQKILEYSFLPAKQRANLINFINGNEYDVVVAVGDTFTLMLSMIAKFVKSKVYAWQHSTYDGYYKKPGCASFGKEIILKKNIQFIDGIMVLTQKDKYKYVDIASCDIIVLHNPLLVKGLEQYEKKFNKEIIFVGRLNKTVKGLDYLLDIFEKIKSLDNSIIIKVIGDGPDREYFEKEIVNRKIDNIVIEGYHRDLDKYYQEAGLLVSTSRWEGFGMSIIEAMAYATPVIAFENDGPNEILGNNEGGILIPRYDTDVFAREICSLMSDVESWRKQSRIAWERAQNYSLVKMVDLFINTINK